MKKTRVYVDGYNLYYGLLKGACADVGYEVLDFDQEVSVGAGTNFAIVVRTLGISE